MHLGFFDPAGVPWIISLSLVLRRLVSGFRMTTSALFGMSFGSFAARSPPRRPSSPPFDGGPIAVFFFRTILQSTAHENPRRGPHPYVPALSTISWQHRCPFGLVAMRWGKKPPLWIISLFIGHPRSSCGPSQTSSLGITDPPTVEKAHHLQKPAVGPCSCSCPSHILPRSLTEYSRLAVLNTIVWQIHITR